MMIEKRSYILQNEEHYTGFTEDDRYWAAARYAREKASEKLFLATKAEIFASSAYCVEAENTAAAKQPAKREHPGTFLAVQEWEGYVEALADGYLTALLLTIKGEDLQARERVEIPLDDLNEDNKKLAKVGAVFRWSIGYFNLHGSRNRMSKLVFRRLPALDARQRLAAKEQAAEVLTGLSFE